MYAASMDSSSRKVIEYHVSSAAEKFSEEFFSMDEPTSIPRQFNTIYDKAMGSRFPFQ